jgi:predicted  nucleic acid-binding Zn-ribbon protein
MQKKVIKVDFAIGDNVQKKADAVLAKAKQIDALLNDAFTPLRQIESLIRKLDKNAAKSEFSEFVKELQSLEGDFQAEKQKAQKAANDLGIALPEMKWINEVTGVLSYAQRSEETARRDINAYNDAYQAASKLLSAIK